MYLNSGGCPGCNPHQMNPIKQQMRQQTAGILSQNGVNPAIMREVAMQSRQLKASGQYRPGMKQQLLAQAMQRHGANPNQVNNVMNQRQQAMQNIRAQYGGGFAGAQPFAGAQAFVGNGFAGAQAFAGFNGGFQQPFMQPPGFAGGFVGGGFPFA